MSLGSETYLFVDGGYLRKTYSLAVKPWFGNEGEICFSALRDVLRGKWGGAPGKMFYYDCLDDIKGASETQEDFERRLEEQKKRLSDIRRLDATHVSLGSLTKQKQKKQKRVDTLIAVDMVKHAYRGNMTHAILLAGDLDFEPVVKFLVDEGLYVEVVADKTSIARDLAEAADYYRELTFEDYYNLSAPWFRASYPLPDYSEASMIGVATGTPTAATGSLAGHACTVFQGETLFQGGPGYILLAPSFADSRTSLYVRASDLERLKLFCKLKWEELQGI